MLCGDIFTVSKIEYVARKLRLNRTADRMH